MTSKLTFQSIKSLPAYARARKSDITPRVCNFIRYRANDILGYHRLQVNGPRLLGKDNFDAVITNGQLPPLLDLLKLAETLNLRLVIKLIQPDYSGSSKSVSLNLPPHLVRSALVSFMLEIYRNPQTEFVPDQLRQYQHKCLRNIRNDHFPIHWSTLISFFAVSGYETRLRLDNMTGPAEVRLPKGVTR